MMVMMGCVCVIVTVTAMMGCVCVRVRSFLKNNYKARFQVRRGSLETRVGPEESRQKQIVKVSRRRSVDKSRRNPGS